MKHRSVCQFVWSMGILLLVALAAPTSAQTTSFTYQGDKAQASGCKEIKFHNLSKYKSDYWSRVFNDAEVGPALRALLKTDLRALKDSLKQPVYPDTPDGSLSFVDQKGVLTLEGGVPQLYTIMEAKLVIEPCGHVYAAVLDEGKRFLYFTNDQNYLDKLPPMIEQWRSKIESARSENGEKPKLPVVFKSK